jgi:CheY-like chemotaxis protein
LYKKSHDINKKNDRIIINQIIDKANNGLHALRMVKNAHINENIEYGLILMDCSMPVMDGYEATELIRLYI